MCDNMQLIFNRISSRALICTLHLLKHPYGWEILSEFLSQVQVQTVKNILILECCFKVDRQLQLWCDTSGKIDLTDVLPQSGS